MIPQSQVLDTLPAPDPQMLTAPDSCGERLDQGRFPQSRFPRHEHHLARSSEGRV
jgi:hypothetical protein